MIRRPFFCLTLFSLALGIAGFAASPVAAQQGAVPGEWHAYGGDTGSNKYSPLDQINTDSVMKLELAWRWDSIDEAVTKENSSLRVGYFKCTPLMVNGVLYASTPLNQVVALNPGTGELIWSYDPKAYERGLRRGSGFQHRGVAYWTDGTDERIIIATKARQLIALNARTGETYSDFGDGGWVDLGKGFDRPIQETQLSFSAPPMVVRDTIILGSLTPDEASNFDVPPGDVRAFDVSTGEQ